MGGVLYAIQTVISVLRYPPGYGRDAEVFSVML